MELLGRVVFDGASWRRGAGWNFSEEWCWMELLGGGVLDGASGKSGTGWSF